MIPKTARTRVGHVSGRPAGRWDWIAAPADAGGRAFPLR